MGKGWVQGPDGKLVRAGDQQAYSASVFQAVDAYISGELRKATNELSAVLRSDQRRTVRLGKIATVAYNITISLLKTIPFVGGYVGLINKVLMNPLGGAYEVLRAEYGGGYGDGAPGGWTVFGGASNSVMSPLTVDPDKSDLGLGGLNLGNGGAPTLFQTNQRYKFEQAEIEIANQLPRIGSVTDLFQNKSSPQASQAKLAISELNAEALSRLHAVYKEDPLWFKLHAIGAAVVADVSGRDGVRDLNADLFNRDDQNWMSASEISSRIQQNLMHSSMDSNMVEAISVFKRKPPSNLDERSRVLTNLQYRRAEIVKAKYVAYREDLTKESIFSTITGKYIRGICKRFGYNLPGPSDWAARVMNNDLGQETRNFASKFISAWGLIHELIAAYFGSGRISALPLTMSNLKAAYYALQDCAASAAAFIAKDGGRSDLWYDWFSGTLAQLPDWRVFLTLLNKYNSEFSGDLNEIAGVVQEPRALTEFSGYGGLSFKRGVGNVFGRHYKANYGGYGSAEAFEDYYQAPAGSFASTVPGVSAAFKPKGSEKYMGIASSIRGRWSTYKESFKALSLYANAETPAVQAVVRFCQELHPLISELMLKTDLKHTSIAAPMASANVLQRFNMASAHAAFPQRQTFVPPSPQKIDGYTVVKYHTGLQQGTLADGRREIGGYGVFFDPSAKNFVLAK